MEFASDSETKKVQTFLDDFFRNIATDFEPVFLSDDAKIWDVSTLSAEELLHRCSEYYRKDVTLDDFNKPLWQLVRSLNETR